MTVVAKLYYDNINPIILGDILLSGEERSSKKVKLPTIDNIIDIFPEGSGFVPVGLCQKIAIISDTLAIGWAGSYIAAKTIIRDLYDQNKSKPFTKESLSDFFKSISQDIWDHGIQLTGLIEDSQGKTSFNCNCYTYESPLFGKVDLLGSGEKDVLNFLNQFSELPTSLAGKPSKVAMALSFALTLTGTLLNSELATHSPLLKYYGGGYEIAGYWDGKLRKLQDITYVYWKARIVNNNVHITQVPLHAFSYTYHGDILTIRSVSFDKINGGTSLTQSGFAIPPIYRYIEEEEISKIRLPTFNNKWICNYFLIHHPSGQWQILANPNYVANEEPFMKFIEEKSGIEFKVKTDFIKMIAKEIHNLINIGKLK